MRFCISVGYKHQFPAVARKHWEGIKTPAEGYLFQLTPVVLHQKKVKVPLDAARVVHV